MRSVAWLLICSSIALSAACGDDGGGGPAAPAVSETALDFGATDCGMVGVPLAFVISNDGDESFGFTAELAGGGSSPYVVTPSSGVVGGNGQLTVLVFPRPVPASGAAGGLDDTLTITTDVEGDTPHTIALSQTARGAVLEASTTTVDFPGARAVGSAPQTEVITIENTGTEAASISIASTHEAFTVPAATTTIDPGDSAELTVSYVPYTAGSIEGELQITATGPTCAGVPAITATGTGTFAGTASDILLVGPIAQRKVSSTLCVRLLSGNVACLGSNTAGARGAGLDVPTLHSTPTVVRTLDGTPLDDVVEMVGYHGHVCARRSDATVYCWGNVANEQFKSSPTGQPFAAEVAQNAVGLAANYGYMCVVGSDGSLSCTGQRPQRWNEVNPTAWNPTGATAVALNGGGGYARLADGTVVSFGVATNGSRGNGDVTNAPPSPVTGLTDVVSLSASVKRNNRVGGGCAVRTDATAVCWGDARHGMTAAGNEVNTAAFVDVQTAAATPLTGISKIASGRNHRCALTSAGVYCWGRGSEGQLGRTAPQNNLFAAPPDPPVTSALAISAAGRGTCFVRVDGGVTCWGRTPFSDGEAHVSIAAFGP